jgi:predicted dienelactone hydrolase
MSATLPKPGTLRRLATRVGTIVVLALATHAAPAAATTLGMTVLPAQGEDEPVTLFYPSSSPPGPLRRDFVTLLAAPDGTPERGNGRLVVVSHGTGGSVIVHTDLARTLVEQGFTVAIPLHKGDNWRDHRPGTFDSPKRRPQEISRAIDAVARDARFAPLLQLDKVGVYGMSAGGFTALTLAGGQWSPQQFVRHCDVNLGRDFQFCTGVFTKLTGGWLDSLKLWVARHEIRRRFEDDKTVYRHTDPRVAAIVAAVPAAAAFDLATLAEPRVPLGLVTMGQDRWLIPAFHAEAVLSVCKVCERVAHLDHGGHGAMLAPLPPGLGGVLGEMLNDPPGFDRAVLPAIDRTIAGYFARHLLK